MSVSEGIPDFEDKGGCEGVSSEIQAAVSWYGALDALEFHNIRMAVDPDYPPRFAVIYGGSPEKMKDVLNKTNPMTYINKKHCPLLAMSSDTDDRISYTVNIEFCEQAEKYGNFAKYVVVKNQGHGYFEGEEYDQTLYDFFAEHLKNRVK